MHANAIKGVACSDELIFSVCASGDAAFHRVGDLGRCATCPATHRKIANGAAALPDGRFVCVSRDLSLRIWSLDGADEFAVAARALDQVRRRQRGRRERRDRHLRRLGRHLRPRAREPLGRMPPADGVGHLVARPRRRGGFVASSYDGRLYAVDRTGAADWPRTAADPARRRVAVAL